MYVGLYHGTQEQVTSLLSISAVRLTEKRLSKIVNTASTPDSSPSSSVSCSGLFAPPESCYARPNFQSKFGQI